MGLPVPEPNSGGSYSDKFIQRTTKSLHAQLALRARQEGVSMNMLVNTLFADTLGRRRYNQSI
jgi:antitoxin HicB